MLKPRTNEAVRLLLVLLLICIASSAPGVSARVYARQPQTEVVAEDTARGIELYRKGDMKGAREALHAVLKQRKTDAYAWHYLGLALLGENDVKAARKAFETAIKLKPDFILAHVSLARVLLNTNKWNETVRAAERLLTVDPQSAEAHYLIGEARLGTGDRKKASKEADAALFIDPNFAPAFLLKSRVITAGLQDSVAQKSFSKDAVSSLLKEAATHLEKYLQLSPNVPDVSSLREQLETLQMYAGLEDLPIDRRTIYKPNELTTKARILSKAEPGYTEEARKNQTEGRVTLRAVLSADGTVKNILVVESLGHGLTELCIRAARKIKFVPATKDGRPVSQVVTIEYNFNVY